MQPCEVTPQLRLAARFALLWRRPGRLLLASEEEFRSIEDPASVELLNSIPPIGVNTPVGAPPPSPTALEALRSQRIVSPSTSGDPAAAAFWDSLDCAPAAGRIAHQALTPAGTDLIRRALAVNHLRIAEDAPHLVVTTDDYLRPELAGINRRDTPWLLAKPLGHCLWIGPLIIPGKTSCWHCLAGWLRAQRSSQGALAGFGEEVPQPSIAALPTTVGWAAGLIATTAAVWLARDGYPDLEDTILSVDTRTLRQTRHPIRRRPDCPRCGSRVVPSPPPSLYSLLSPVTGLATTMETTDRPVCGLYHAHAIVAPPLPRSKHRLPMRRLDSVGKGQTVAIAETACLAEAVERYSAVHQGDEPSTHGTLDAVGGIAPESILLFSETQYDSREHWNRTHSPFHHVPERFDPAESIEWVSAQSLTGGEPQLVPSALCYMYYGFSGGRRFCDGDTNGCAAGRSKDDAIRGALLELIERDSVAIWWYNRLRRPAIHWQSLDDPRAAGFQAAFQALGRTAHVLDITTDTGVPACVAIAPRLDGSEPCFGAAAALSARDAVVKALSEAAQICFWLSTGDGTEELRSWIRSTSLDQAAYLAPRGTCPAPAAIDWTTCLTRLQQLGIHPCYVDLTRPEAGVPVVRAIAPGLRHFWARLGPGRLYDVPVSMGWLPRPLPETEMNPIGCMI